MLPLTKRQEPAPGWCLSRNLDMAVRAQPGLLLPMTGPAFLVFMDGDGSDVPAEMGQLLEPILAGECDFVIGSRMRGKREPGSMLVSQIFAGWLAGVLLRLLYRVRYTDMGPFRAITREALSRLHMREETYGWNLEMQMRAAQCACASAKFP